MTQPLLRLEHVSKQFTIKGRHKIAALQDVSLSLYKGEHLGVVGESGCGKSTLARTIMGVYPDAEGTIFFNGSPLNFKNRRGRLLFAQKAQMVFQDPYTSLNPRMTVEDIVGENLVIHSRFTPAGRREKVCALLESVGLRTADMGRYPGDFSGGQRQRIGIARALALDPELLVCDEPISALDVSIQSQIMNLLKQLGKERGTTFLFISHDLNMVRYLSERIAVMYLGSIVELAPADELYESCMHPYTKRLLESVLTPDPAHRLCGLQAQFDEVPMTHAVQNGCAFAERCPRVRERCYREKPAFRDLGADHWIACHEFED